MGEVSEVDRVRSLATNPNPQIINFRNNVHDLSKRGICDLVFLRDGYGFHRGLASNYIFPSIKYHSGLVFGDGLVGPQAIGHLPTVSINLCYVRQRQLF